jgi:exodeoxyribonuclease V alpha subunit
VDEGSVLPFGDEETGPGSEAEPDLENDPGQEDGSEQEAGGESEGGGEPDAGGQSEGGGEQEAGGESEGGGGILLALSRYALAEEAIAEALSRLAALAEPLPQSGAAGTAPPDGGSADAATAAVDDDAPPDNGSGPAALELELDEAQRAAVCGVAEHGVCVLSGGPGTGKSRTVAAVVAMAGERGLRVALAAPTGRAAKRLEELAGAPATTLHRLLGAQGRGSIGRRDSPPGAGQLDEASAGEAGRAAASDAGAIDGGPAWVFTRNESWPLDADLVVVDEVSMLDAELAAALVEACADGTRLLLVGDPAQLPSIGPGRVLADIIDSGAIPVTELTRLYRQQEGGVIARLATAVRGGVLPPVDSPDREVVVVPVRSSSEAARRVVQLVTDSIPRALGIPAAEVQVITPVHKGAAGTIELNRALKQRLNPGPGTRGGFDPGDRVVSIANHADEGFTNGEVGSVVSAVDDGLLVAFPAGPVNVSSKILSDLRHGWALTVHRAQGSEWPAVVAVFPAEATGMLSRPLVYTALTRAQRHLSVVHGAGPALSRAVATVGERPRVTRLASLLASAIT